MCVGFEVWAIIIKIKTSKFLKHLISQVQWSGIYNKGLSNYCLSCCVNTLLQTLSATWELADLLDKWDTAGVRMEGRNVPLHLKGVLTAMRSEILQPAPHQDFLHCLDKNRVRLNVQHDADEVFLFILNSMLQQMNDKPLALEIQNLYKISVETQLQCLECSSLQTQSSYLLSMPLHIKEDHDSLEDCLTSFFEHQELWGINSCFCPKCEMKTPSKQGFKLLSLPQILCVNLKRARNSRFGTQKLNCKVTFPERFDFSDAVKEAFSSNSALTGHKYTLYAVVVHSGSAMCGHYTAYVRHRMDQRWYYADDSHVKQVDTAYMLMYRRDASETTVQLSDGIVA
uniref:USP domain-containing protein n=1 Tax=Mola mola TaxID=94237 RepID=A0A3Q3VK78_MOLML